MDSPRATLKSLGHYPSADGVVQERIFLAPHWPRHRNSRHREIGKRRVKAIGGDWSLHAAATPGR